MPHGHSEIAARAVLSKRPPAREADAIGVWVRKKTLRFRSSVFRQQPRRLPDVLPFCNFAEKCTFRPIYWHTSGNTADYNNGNACPNRLGGGMSYLHPLAEAR